MEISLRRDPMKIILSFCVSIPFSRSYSPRRKPWNVRITGEGEGTEATERMV